MHRTQTHRNKSLALLCLPILAICSTPAFAKPRLHTYQSPCSQVWPAVKRATAPPHYNFAQMDDAQMKGLVSTGNNWSGKRYLDITLTSPTPGTCTVAVGGQFSGIEHNDKGDLFNRTEEEIKPDPATAPAPAAPPAK